MTVAELKAKVKEDLRKAEGVAHAAEGKDSFAFVGMAGARMAFETVLRYLEQVEDDGR